jgi:hypothetical protein
MANNSKNWDRFYKPFKTFFKLSSTVQTFDSIIVIGPSTIVDVSGSPMSTWTIQVTGVPVAATLWSVSLEGSTDGIEFSEILKHTSLTGDGINLYSGTTLFLALYYRINVTQLTLGPATSIRVSIIGKQ